MFEKLRAKLGFPVYLEHRTKEGWSGSLPFYLCWCPEHGYFEDYPHGFKQRLDCPECREDFNKFVQNHIRGKAV